MAQNPLFGNGDTLQEEDTSEVYQGEDQTAYEEVELAPDTLQSTPKKSLLRWVTKKQSIIKESLTKHAYRFIREGSGNLLLLLSLSFLLGMIHSLGPGHNKLIIFSYFLSERPAVGKGVLFGFLVAMIHATSGIVTAFSVHYGLSYLGAFKVNSTAMDISYYFILLIGIVLFVQGLLRFKKQKEESMVKEKSFKKMLPVALAVGIVPCPATMIWVSFLLIEGQATLAAFAGLSVGLGMAASLVIVALLSILFNSLVRSVFTSSSHLYSSIVKFISLFSSLIIIALALIMLF